MTETTEYIIEKVNSLKAAIETETIKINTLNKLTNYLQVRAWRKYRKKLGRKLRYYKKRLKNS